MTHAWHVDEAEYARHESRRGRRHAFEVLVPARTALVVIDMVAFFGEENPYCRAILPHVERLATSLRDAGGLVVWVIPRGALPLELAEELLGPEVVAAYATPDSELWHELDVREEDLVVEKSAPSAFFPGRTPLPDLLAERGIDTVLITGTVTNVCCESSARDAATLGYRVVMVADANAAPTDELHNATLRTVYRSFGDVRTTDDVIGLLS